MVFVEEPFDYYQYNYCITLYLGEKHAHAKSFFNRQRNYPSTLSSRAPACLIYSMDRSQVLHWGSEAAEKHKEFSADPVLNENNSIYVDNFMNDIQRIYSHKPKKSDDKEVELVLQSVTDYLIQLTQDLKVKWLEKVGKENTSTLNFHYVFVVPTDWDTKIRETILRPIFIRANLISANDDPNRLLFFSKLESLLQLIQHPKYLKRFGIHGNIKKSQQYLMYGIASTEEDMTISLDTFEVKDSLQSNTSIIATLVPRVFKSNRFKIDFNCLKNRLKKFLESSDDLNNMIQYFDQHKYEQVLHVMMDRFLNREVEKSKSHAEQIDIQYLKYPFKKPGILDCLELNSALLERLSLISAQDMFEILLAPIEKEVEKNFRNVLSNNFIKMRCVILMQENSFERQSLPQLILQWLMILLNKHRGMLNLKLLSIDDIIKSAYYIEGAGRKMLELIKTADMLLPPKLIRRNSLNDETSMTSIFADTHPGVIVYINISYKSVKFSCVKLGDDHHAEEIIHIHSADSSNRFGLRSLDNFFDMSDKNLPVILKAKPSFILFLEAHLSEGLAYFSKYDRATKKQGRDVRTPPRNKSPAVKKNLRKPVKSQSTTSRQMKIQQMNTKDQTEYAKVGISQPKYFFSQIDERCMKVIENVLLEKVDEVCDSEAIDLYQQQKYIKGFLLIYLGYINKTISTHLARHFKSASIENQQVGYAITLETSLLHQIVGGKKKASELLFASGILERDNQYKKAQIVKPGEGFLPVLQQDLDIQLPLKSYYVLAQLHEEYVQLTLYQVVQLETEDTQASSIVIHDESAIIPETYESLYRNIWYHIQANISVQCCNTHTEEFQDELFTLEGFKDFKDLCKSHLLQHNSSSIESFIDPQKLFISKTCNCSVNISARDIIENAFKPIILDIVSVISSSLVNPELFGKYIVDSAFVVGNLFEDLLPYGSPLHTKLTAYLHEEMIESIEYKEMQPACYVLPKPLSDLVQPLIGKIPFLHESFCNGSLHQVSRENYGLDFYTTPAQKDTEVTYLNDHTKKILPGYAAVILQRGQIISNTSIEKTFAIKLKGNNYLRHMHIRLIRFNSLNDDVDFGDIVPIDTIFCDTLQKFLLKYTLKKHSNSTVLRIMIKMTPKHHFSSLHFTARLIGEDDQCKSSGTFVYLGEQLTLAYL